jgi:hypothetical protein
VPTNSSSLAPVPPTKVVHDYGYDYDSVCVFAELAEGYQLPVLSKNFYSDTEHFSLKGTERGPNEKNSERYSYSNAGISAEVLLWPTQAYFRWSRMDPSRLPEVMRVRQNMVSLLSVARDKSTGDVASLGCETHTVIFHFDKDRLLYVELYGAII